MKDETAKLGKAVFVIVVGKGDVIVGRRNAVVVIVFVGGNRQKAKGRFLVARLLGMTSYYYTIKPKG